MPEPTKRLSKVAREFNVSIPTIIDFLSDKGIAIEAKPNAKIAPDVYSVLVDEFQDEKLVKEESRLVGLNKVKRETVTLDDKEKKSEPNQEQEEIIIKNMENVTSGIGDIVKPQVEEKDIKIVGKIDLEPKNKVVKDEPKAEEPKAEEPPVAEEKPPVEEQPKVEVKAEPEVKEEKEAPKKEEEKKEEPKSETEKPKETQLIKAKAEILAGPKVVDKIILPEKRVKKPVASSSDDDKGKRKRKRIRTEGKGKVNPNAKNEQPPNKKKGGGRRFNKNEQKGELNEEEIKKQISETLDRLKGTGKSKSSKHRRAKREAISQQIEEEERQREEDQKLLSVTEFVTANELASMMSVSVNEVISACMSLGLFVSINQRLDAETLSIVAEEFGYKVEFTTAEVLEAIQQIEDPEDTLEVRPPIVTVMGHVDHGKTSLLDYIRKTNVIDGEAGGITQHIGAYSVLTESGKRISFLDTPGHEAFTAMRARGAQVTDVVIIIVAADDDVMPQTKEAINHAQAAGVPMVFAINKIDKPGANADKIKEQLSQMNILVEEWGGKYQSQEISAKKGLNISELLDKVLLEAELLELKANPNRNANGAIIEASLDKGKGYVTTLIVQGGTMRVGDMIIAGSHYGKVKAMHDENGENVLEAGPSRPVSILGLSGAPSAGDKFNVLDDEKEARRIATKREQLRREQGVKAQKHITLDEIGRRLAIGDFKELNLIVKGDVDGSVEALSDSLLKQSTENVQINVIHKSVGQISETDVLLASASDAIIIGFQVRPSGSARKLAEKEEIDIRMYSVIYDAIEEIKAAMEGMLSPKFEEKIVCNIEVRETFKISKVGTIAGCYVQDGTVSRNTNIRLIRDGIVVHTGTLGSLKRFKDDVKEVKAGYECGLNIDKFNDIRVGDIIEGYEEVEVKRKK